METRDPIEKLRELEGQLEGYGNGMYAPRYSELEGIADEIEAAYIKLPVDADDVPIHIGDVLYTVSGKERITAGLVFQEGASVVVRTEGGGVLMCHECRHVKPATVESLLKDFVKDFTTHHTVYVPDFEKDEFGEYLRELRDDYAERIRKAVER